MKTFLICLFSIGFNILADGADGNLQESAFWGNVVAKGLMTDIYGESVLIHAKITNFLRVITR